MYRCTHDVNMGKNNDENDENDENVKCKHDNTGTGRTM